VNRPGVPLPDAPQLQAAGLDPQRTIICLGHTPDISGSELREAIANGEAVGEWLPDAVQGYIAQNRLYRHNR
jgi:nicotinic acid mononucleotide adenylyltransferase